MLIRIVPVVAILLMVLAVLANRSGQAAPKEGAWHPAPMRDLAA